MNCSIIVNGDIELKFRYLNHKLCRSHTSVYKRIMPTAHQPKLDSFASWLKSRFVASAGGWGLKNKFWLVVVFVLSSNMLSSFIASVGVKGAFEKQSTTEN